MAYKFEFGIPKYEKSGETTAVNLAQAAHGMHITLQAILEGKEQFQIKVYSPLKLTLEKDQHDDKKYVLKAS